MTPAVLSFVPDITPGSLGIFAILGTVVVALIKAWPVLSLQAIQAKERLRGEERSDLSDCQKQITALRQDVQKLGDGIHHLELKLLGTISAYKLLDTEVEMHLPDSAVLKQARALMSTAFAMSPSTNPGLYEGREVTEIRS
jgi:hypothetical protein